MKKTILIFAMCISLNAIAQAPVNKNLAQVETIKGLSIYMHSKPVAETIYLGSVSCTTWFKDNPMEVINTMIKKCRKDFPDAEGIIFTSDDLTKADAIKFKN